MRLVIDGVQISEVSEKPPRKPGHFFGKLVGLSIQRQPGLPGILPIYRYGLIIEKEGSLLTISFKKYAIFLMPTKPFISFWKKDSPNDDLMLRW